MFEALGVNRLDESVYLRLLHSGGGQVSQLADLVGADADGIRDSLARLEANGLVTRSGRSDVWLPTAPDVAADVLVAQRRRELEEARRAAAGLMGAYQQALTGQRPLDTVEMVSGSDAVMQRYLQLQRVAERELCAFDTPPYLSQAIALNELEVEFLGRGIACRSIYSRAALAYPGQMESLQQLIAAGEQARVTAQLPMKLVLIDARYAMVPLASEASPLEAALIVHARGVVDALCRLFELEWERAIAIRTVGDGATLEEARSAPVTEEELRLLTLLAAGFTDEHAAKRLGVNQRTVQRRVAALMDRCGAESRLQLGVQAARRGWLGG